MRIVLSVLVSIGIILVGWFAIGVLLNIFSYLAVSGGYGSGVPYFIHVLFVWIMGPAFGGFVGAFSTPRIFKSVSVEKFHLALISSVLAISGLFLIFSMFGLALGDFSIWYVLGFILQGVSLVVGIKLGSWFHRERVSKTPTPQ